MYNFAIQLQTDGKKCLYEQIYEYIRQEIRDGKLLAGERLPSTRSLADFLQVSRSTVEYAYDQLLSEGYIEARPCRGYFVCVMEDLLFGEKHKNPGYEADVSGQEQEEGKKEDWICDFSPNGVDMSEFPFSVWKRIGRNVMTEGNRELYERGDAQGDFELRQTIARYLHSSRGVRCRPEQIVIGAGNDYLLMLLDKIFGRKMKIAMENPTYLRAYRLFDSFGYEIEQVEMDQSGMSVAKLSKTDAAGAYVMPSHQFPMGTVMPIGRRTELLRWAGEHEERYIIEDDYDSEFRYRGKPIPSLQSSDTKNKVIYIGTFSKAIAPAIRVGYMVLPERLLEKYRENCYFYSCTVSRIDQRILHEFISNGHFERHLNKMRKIYRIKHEMLLEELKPLKEDFRISGVDAGLHILLTAKDGRPDRELIAKAAEERIKVYALSDSVFSQERQSSTVLVGFGGLSQEEITEGSSRLTRAFLGR